MRHHLMLLLAFVGTACTLGDKPGKWLDQDPSTIPAEGHIFRFCADFNNDGVPDVAVSADRSEFGKMGGAFELYLGTGHGRWRSGGEFFAHPLAVHLEKSSKGQGILSVYIRDGGQKGGIVRYSVTAEGLKELSSKEIYPGDDSSGHAEYGKYLGDAVRLQPELGTLVNGTMSWSRYDR